MGRSIIHDEFIYKGREVVLDTSQDYYGYGYETMVLYRDTGEEIDSCGSKTEDEARRIHAEFKASYLPDPKPLTGKYAKLRDDLKAALSEGRSAEDAEGEDSGTCNFDSPSLYLPRWNRKLVEQAAKEAGSSCFTWKLCGTTHYVFRPDTHSQGWPRSKNAEVSTKALERMGYDALEYCQMD